MRRLASVRIAAAALAAASLLGADGPAEAPITVRYAEGITHGFLTLQTLEGAPLADGDLIQTAKGDEVTSRMVLHFRDGSLQDETAVFRQRGRFHLVSDHLVQKGPAFPTALDVVIDVSRGAVTVRSTEAGGRERTSSEHLDLPEDLANGMVIVMLKNVAAASSGSVSMLVASPKVRIVRLVLTRIGEDSFAIGASPRKAIRWNVRVELGGVAGVVAPLIGKQPPDTLVWITAGDAPTFLKSEGPLYPGGPPRRLELAIPSWPASRAPDR